MASGFVGKSAEQFFDNTSNALETAGTAHNKQPFEGQSKEIRTKIMNLI